LALRAVLPSRRIVRIRIIGRGDPISIVISSHVGVERVPDAVSIEILF